MPKPSNPAADLFLGVGRLLYDDGHDDWQAVYAEELGIPAKRLTDIRRGKADLNRNGVKDALLTDALRLIEREAEEAARRLKVTATARDALKAMINKRGRA